MADNKPVAMEPRDEAADGRRYSPSTARNREPIRDVFAAQGLGAGRALEIASGTGEHGAFLTEQFPELSWSYSDIDADGRASQSAWKAAAGHDRLSGPLVIDASSDDWGDAEAGDWDLIVSMNMVHISPFAATEGLLRGAGRLLKPGGHLFLYGPYARNGEIAPSNAAFDENLKSRDPAWGVRDLDTQIVPLAEAAGLSLKSVIEMPANNLVVVFQRS
jgi:SAM-dependent methyltransferase